MAWLDDEIAEQPTALARLLDAEADHVAEVARTLAPIRSIVIAARGSSDNAARYAQYLFGVHHRLPVGLAAPSLITRYGTAPRLDGALVVGISQSGESPDIVAVVEDARAQGCPTVALTNVARSPLAAAAEWVIGLHAGQERSVAATKTYLSSLGALALLSASMDRNPRRLRALGRMPEAVAEVIAQIGPLVARIAEPLGHCLVVGRGFNYATAFEIALKLKELTLVGAEPYSSADVRHGPIATVDDGYPVVVVAPSGAVLEDLRALVGGLRERRAHLIGISDAPALLGAVDVALPLPAGIAEWLSPLAAVVPGQLLAARLAHLGGGDVDRPGGLSKITWTR